MLDKLEQGHGNLGEIIHFSKNVLRNTNSNYVQTFKEFTQYINAEVAEIKRLKAAGKTIIPEIEYIDIVENNISSEQKAWIHQRGCVIIRNTFAQSQAEAWGDEIKSYIENIGYLDQPDKGLDKYFSSLQDQKPQIYSVYWSKPQVEARQSENLATARKFLNRLWEFEHGENNVFDPDRECTYADRTRRRQPGDNSLGLKPHIDGGSVERWLDASGYQHVYRHVINGDWKRYNPWDARYRTDTTEIPSPAVCQMFRTFQGWTALSEQGPGDGTLQLIPIVKTAAWMLLRALQSDVPEDSLCNAVPARALLCDPDWHELALQGLISLPKMNPGDTVWWHPDLVHAVEDEHKGQHFSNVIYIAAAPYCEKNAAYLAYQAKCFVEGKSAPDFAAENYEVDTDLRANMSDLTDLGKKQMGMLSW
jgi:hypothetical protein